MTGYGRARRWDEWSSRPTPAELEQRARVRRRARRRSRCSIGAFVRVVMVAGAWALTLAVLWVVVTGIVWGAR